MGKIVTLAAKIEISTAVPTSKQVLTGFPVMAFCTNYAPVIALENTNKSYLYLDIMRNATSGNNGGLYTRTPISAGASLRISMTYCAND